MNKIGMNNIGAKVTAFLLTLLVASTSCVVQRSPITGDRRAYGYSWEKEIQIGREADGQIQQQYGIYDNREFAEYVDNIGQEMLEVSHMRRESTPQKYRETAFTFRVLDSPVTNAFALPGGYVYVTRGLLSHLNDEAQLAVVLGHEIGHVAARHASQRAFEQKVGQIALIGGAVAGEQFLGIPGGNILDLGSQAAQLLFLSYGRDDERESDNLGVEYAAKKKYKAAEGAEFFVSLERIAEKAGQNIPTWQSTHPDPEARAQTIPELARKWESEGYEQTVTGKGQYMSMLDNIVYGNNPREGFTENGIFYHPELTFQFPYPDNWQLVNQRSFVAVVNPDQDAVSIVEVDTKIPSAEASVNAFLNEEGIKTVKKSRASNHGLQAYEATANGETQQGKKLRFYIYAVQFEGNVYRFLSYSAADRFSNYRRYFTEISNGFRELQNKDIADIQPVRLQTEKVDRTGEFRSFLPGNLDELPIEITPGDLAILNQVELDQTIEAGTWLKIPRQ